MLQQFRIANGEKLDITEDPEPRGHAIEFRINGEDAGRGFLPAPGPVTNFTPPTGPGVRLDSGVETGSVIGGQFDSMLAKLIVHGGTREEALARSRRALAEFTVEGLATVIPFHRAVVADPAFIGDDDGFTVHTRWIETEWDNTVEPFTGGDPIERKTPSRGRRSSSRWAGVGSRCRCPAISRWAVAPQRPQAVAWCTRSPSRASAARTAVRPHPATR